MICFPLRLTSSEPIFFTRFDLMNWKDYGIMKRYIPAISRNARQNP